jgi:hypothetical protein
MLLVRVTQINRDAWALDETCYQTDDEVWSLLNYAGEAEVKKNLVDQNLRTPNRICHSALVTSRVFPKNLAFDKLN